MSHEEKQHECMGMNEQTIENPIENLTIFPHPENMWYISHVNSENHITNCSVSLA